MKKKNIILIQITLLVLQIFAISYIYGKTFEENKLEFKESKNLFEKILPIYGKIITKIFNERNMVSASVEVYTCLETNYGELCRPYAIFDSEQKQKMQEECSQEKLLPIAIDEVSECKPGVCYDSFEGRCIANTIKKNCEDDGGIWKNDQYGNIPECKVGCCVLGDQANLYTTQQCERQSRLSGLDLNYYPEINDELSCIALSKVQEEGACVFESQNLGEKNSCNFVSREICVKSGGDFFADTLCSNPELNTKCEKQKTTSCVEGKDEVYWFDSCGNRENIYSTNKAQSWNEGYILAKQDSCVLGDGKNPFENQAICGNCNYLYGSTCKQKTNDEELADSSQDFVCRDIRCVDSEGNYRENGESWCEYQGDIGVEKGSRDLLRSSDVPGSNHYRAVCSNGEVQIEACADFRNGICVESRTKNEYSGGEFSSASCRINRWQQCLDYNFADDIKTKDGKDKRDDKCTENPDCFVKEIKISDNFKFNYCVPKYPEGFDLKGNSDAAEQICTLASQKCTVTYVKELSGWKCVSNCECETKIFAEQMNDLCISLGDCGANVNYNGEFSDGGYSVKNAPKLSESYVAELKKNSETPKDQYAEPGNLSDYFGSLGLPDDLGKGSEVKDPTKSLQSFGTIAGMGGVALIAAAKTAIGATILAKVGLVGYVATETSLGTTAAISGTFSSTAGGASAAATSAGAPGASISPVLSATGGALAGAAIGFAAVSLLLKYTGVGAGLPPALAYTLMAAGAVAGAIIGAQVAVALGASSTGLFGSLASFGPIGWIILAVVVVIIVIMKLIGIGETKEIIVEFGCYPWEPPYGGKSCELCGEDGKKCSEYSCQSLGQTCEFINKGTGDEKCVDINPNDVTPPEINPLRSVISEGFAYQDINSNGFGIKGTGNEECIGSYEDLIFGIELNEPARCRYDTERTEKFEDMEFEFGGRTTLLKNHTQYLQIPSLESLGIPGYDPTRKADYNLYIRCKDASGNSNVQEKVINFCVKPGIDSTPPRINYRQPELEYVSFNASSINATIYTNEPSECKWSEEDKDYDLMENIMLCENGLTERVAFGWKCDSEFPVYSNKNDSKVYIRCEDQPWLIEDDGTGKSKIKVDEGTDPETGEEFFRYVDLDEQRTRNKNSQSYEFKILRSKSELKIENVQPYGKIEFGTQPVSVEINLTTSGGVDGTARCGYEFNDYYIDFLQTFGKTHRQVFQTFFEGNKEMKIKCEDVAGNVAYSQTNFEIVMDTNPPIATRIYDQSGTLYLITDESAECALVSGGIKKRVNQCGFGFSEENITTMNGNGRVHTVEFQSGIHYIKCKDEFGNTPGSCTAIVNRG